ncbi:MAG: phosphatase PAP2 family protein [Candidatus Omnitrophota bacterium]|jgi:hypothetical protein
MKFKNLLITIIILSNIIIGCESTQAETVFREPKVEKLISLDYAKLVIDDAWHVATAPARFDKNEWLVTGLGAAAIVGAMVFSDKSLRKENQEHRNKTKDNLAKAFQPFGAGYSFGILGAFELEGVVFNDERPKAVARDGLAASVVSLGIIVPLKLIAGRSRPDKDKGAHDFHAFSGNDSFPSAHVTQAFAVASVIAGHYDSWYVKAGSYSVASMVGYARVERNAHWASDVLAGALIGTVVGMTITKFNKDRRYQLSPVADEDTLGLKVAHSF